MIVMSIDEDVDEEAFIVTNRDQNERLEEQSISNYIRDNISKKSPPKREVRQLLKSLATAASKRP